MNTNSRFFPQIAVFTFLLLIFSITAQAQLSEPDESIKSQMLNYLAKLDTSSQIIRQANSDQTASIEKTVYRTEAIKGVSTANYTLEREAFDLLNQQRLNKGLQPFKWNEEMANVARLHSGNMARFHFFSHYGQDNSDVTARAKSLGINGWESISENIAFNKGFRKPVEMACQHWMNSQGHRENILDQKWTETGIGVAIAPDGSYYFTQVFIVR